MSTRRQPAQWTNLQSCWIHKHFPLNFFLLFTAIIRRAARAPLLIINLNNLFEEISTSAHEITFSVPLLPISLRCIALLQLSIHRAAALSTRRVEGKAKPAGAEIILYIFQLNNQSSLARSFHFVISKIILPLLRLLTADFFVCNIKNR